MARKSSKALTTDVLQEEMRFLLKTLLRDDLFGEEVSLTEAEKLLENSLSIGFVDYCAFLKRQGLVAIDRVKNTVNVLERGHTIASGVRDNALLNALSAHFASRLEGGAGHEVQGGAFGGGNGELIDGRYQRGEAIGQGTLGTVYQARQVLLDQEVALKEMRHVFDYVTYIEPAELTSRIKEATLRQAKLNHPHILSVRDLVESDTLHVVLGYAGGGSLKERMARAKEQSGGVLKTEQSLRIFLQICYGLNHAHAHDVVHGDLKPENVLFDHAGNVLLSDFGAASVTRGDEGKAPVYVGTGTPSYMAPEQLHSAQEGPAADIYAVGILLYEMLTGALPGRRSPMPSEVNKEVSAGLDDIFDRMTQDKIADRFASFEEVLGALYKVLPTEQVLSRGNLLLHEVDPFPPPAPEPVQEEAKEAVDYSTEDTQVAHLDDVMEGEASEAAPVVTEPSASGPAA